MMRTKDRMRRGGLSFLVFLLMLMAWPGQKARAGTPSPKPTVLLLLDTSGSMEYSIDALAEEGEVPTCHDTQQTGITYAKSRWVVATEVLTGTFNDYWCSYDFRNDDPLREDYLYPVPHVVPHGTSVDGSTQRFDGLLDIFGESIKFGLMTFDARFNASTDAAGGYSFGEDKEWGGFQINLGARNENAPWGAFVSPPKQDNTPQVAMANEAVQQQILLSTPYLGTPISPQLEDALWYFENHPNGKPYSNDNATGDPYYECRTKSVILITDGQPTLGEGGYGYDLSSAAAAELLEAGVKVYVVGFQMPASTFPVVNQIAESGGTGNAYIVSSQSELVATLGEILVEIQGSQTSQVKTIITNRTMNYDDKQYQFNASFRGTSVSPLDLVGELDQFIFRCDSSCYSDPDSTGAALCDVFSISDALANRTQDRTIYTQLEGQLEDFTVENSAVTSDLLEIPTSGTLAQLDPHILPDGSKLYSGISLGDANDPTVRSQYREQLIRLVRADVGSRREGIPMGAIFHSEPAVQSNLFNISAPLPSFAQYRQKEEIRMRPTTLFVGTHDGMMHAFRVDRYEDLVEGDWGTELWSFVPKHLLPRLNELAGGISYLMDGSPVVKEVRLYKDAAVMDLEEETELWRSVLLSGYRDGGRGYFALDVTDPENPQFMWEISNTERCFNVEGTTNCVETTDFDMLGKTHSKPAIGSVYLDNEGTLEERAVAIFGGGAAVDGDSSAGKAVFIVNLQTGELIRKFCNSCGNVVDGNDQVLFNWDAIDNPMLGDVAAYDEFIGALVTRAFIGDSGGQLWRLDLASNDPDDWVLEFLHDPYVLLPPTHSWRRPVTMRPSIATTTTLGQVAVLYGTYDPESVLNTGWSDRLFSLNEYWNGSGFEATVNWQLVLQGGESLTSEPVVFDEVAYFTTQTSGGGACDIGVGRLWGLDYNGDSPSEITDLLPKLDQDGEPITQDNVKYIEFENSDLLGLALVQRPSCFGTPGDYTPWSGGSESASVPTAGSPYSPGSSSTGPTFAGASSGNLELVVQTGDTGVSSPEMEPPQGTSSSVSTGNKAIQKLVPPSQTVFSTSWGMVFD